MPNPYAIYYGKDWHICFSDVNSGYDVFKTQIIGLSLDEAKKWLELLNKEWEFEWKIKKETIPVVEWKRPKPHDKYGFTIFHGNFVKGVNEFYEIAKKHLKDKTKDPFLLKNWRATKESGAFVNHNHYPFPYKAEEYPLFSMDFKEVANFLIEKDPPKGGIWTSLLKK